MVKINDGDGKTKETAIVITDANDHREAREFYWNFLNDYKDSHGYDNWEPEEIGNTLDQLIAIHRFYKNRKLVDVIWIDYTIFFHNWDK